MMSFYDELYLIDALCHQTLFSQKMCLILNIFFPTAFLNQNTPNFLTSVLIKPYDWPMNFSFPLVSLSPNTRNFVKN